MLQGPSDSSQTHQDKGFSRAISGKTVRLFFPHRFPGPDSEFLWKILYLQVFGSLGSGCARSGADRARGGGDGCGGSCRQRALLSPCGPSSTDRAHPPGSKYCLEPSSCHKSFTHSGRKEEGKRDPRAPLSSSRQQTLLSSFGSGPAFFFPLKKANRSEIRAALRSNLCLP